ncbi:MAG: hypothetical protein KC619_03260 [Myxococcales bacterium]|nr:hypothetical protein [Myxococcales bacterium]
MARRLFLFALLATGCMDAGPYCGLPADATGRLVPYCGNARAEPVCSYPGQEAHYEMGAAGLLLVGGERASCGADDEITCPMGTEGEAFCLTDPEL